MTHTRPLEGMLVIDMSQFLAGPSAGLRLADLGARVIKIERPDGGDICRDLYVSDVSMNDASSIFLAINRNKESFTADLKNPTDKAQVMALVERADVLIHNFRPGVIERLGFDWDTVRRVNPSLVFGEISGYGKEGPWRTKPGQDLLLQSISGLTWLSGDGDDGPVPFGLAIADIIAGAHLVQGILACLVRRGVTGKGGHVEVSMLESILDFQFESVTLFRHDRALPERSSSSNAHAYLGAPYGVYRCKSGYLAIAMAPIPLLGRLIDCPELEKYDDPNRWFAERDRIKAILAVHLRSKSASEWLAVLEAHDVWCAEVMDWPALMNHEGFRVLEANQEVTMSDGYSYITTRCPIRINDEVLRSPKGSPKLGEHREAIRSEFALGGLDETE